MTDLIYGNTGENKEKLIYDCYAVSNHFGNMGFGHYTAFCRSASDDKWYEFDDGRVSPVTRDPQKTVVSSAAYNLFFRRRDWHERNRKEGCDWDKIAVKPDMDFLEKSGN